MEIEFENSKGLNMLSRPTILVCTDFKPVSDLALRSAETMRKKVGGKIHVVHISDFTVQWDWFAEDSSSLLFQNETLTARLQKTLNQMMVEQLQRCEVNCTNHISFGPVDVGIMSSIKETKSDLVIMGHRGNSQGVLNLGGVASKIIASSTIPVLVIKKLITSPLGKVAGLVDTNDNIQPIILATEEFSYLLSAEPEIISVYKRSTPQVHTLAPMENLQTIIDAEELKEKMIIKKMEQSISETLDKRSKCRVRIETTYDKHIAYHLSQMLQDEDVDLAIMKRHHKNFIQKMLIGSETRRMLELFQGNILVLPPEPEIDILT
jgi:nucleotide-binding universal stress UspA family protein